MNSSFKYMYFLAVGSLRVISLYFYCLCLARGESWLSGLIFPYLHCLTFLFECIGYFQLHFYYEIQIVFWKYVVFDELQEKHSGFLIATCLSACQLILWAAMGFKATVLHRICHFEKLYHTSTLGLDFLLVCRLPAIHAWTTGALDRFCR